MTVYTFDVEGMHCASCGLLIDDALEELGGVHHSHTDMRTGRSIVEADPALCSPEMIAKAIAAEGYQAMLREEA